MIIGRKISLQVMLLGILWGYIAFLASTALAQSELIYDMDWSPDGSELAVGYGDGTIVILNDTGQIVRTLHVDTGIRITLDWHPTESKIAVASYGDIVIVDAQTGETLLLLLGYDSEGFLARWIADGTVLAVSGTAPGLNHAIYLLDPCTGEILRSFSGPNDDNLTAMEASPDGTRISSGDGDGLVVIWDVDSGEPVVQFSQTQGLGEDQVQAIAWSPDGTRLATVGRFETVQVWDAVTGQRAFQIQPLRVSDDIAWSPDGTRIAGVAQNELFVWDALTGQEVGSISGIGSVYAVVWSPDGTQLVYGGSRGQVHFVPVPDSIADTPTPIPLVTSLPSPTKTPHQ